MAGQSLVCDQCSAKIRYAAEQAGRKAKCPRCKNELVIPYPEVGADEEEAPVLVKPEPENHCAGCGKKIKPGVTRCKRCREEAKGILATRMKQETAFENAYAKQASFLASTPRGGSFPHALHIVATICTAGFWAPVYIRSYMIWKAK